MVLKEEILNKLNTPRCRVRIAYAMGLTENAVRKYILRKDEKLTQYSALQAIKELMGVDNELELLEEREVKA